MRAISVASSGPQWVKVTGDGFGETERLSVPGGWIYREWHTTPSDGIVTVMCFVPDPDAPVLGVDAP